MSIRTPIFHVGMSAYPRMFKISHVLEAQVGPELSNSVVTSMHSVIEQIRVSESTWQRRLGNLLKKGRSFLLERG